MRSNLILIAAVAALSLPSAALAQDASAPPPPEDEAADSAAAANAGTGAVSAANEADITTGKPVYDKNGEIVGTVESSSAVGAVVKTDSARVQIPLTGFGKNATGLVLGLTKAEVDSAAKANAPQAPAETPPQQ